MSWILKIKSQFSLTKQDLVYFLATYMAGSVHIGRRFWKLIWAFVIQH